MKLTRREACKIGAVALFASTAIGRVGASEPTVFISGENLPSNLDPHQVLDALMAQYALNTYDALYRYLDNPPQQVPWLAESHTTSEDGLVWDIRLRRGAKFHDGSEITAEDVVYSFQRVLALGLAPAGPFLTVLKPEGVTAPESHLVRFKLEQPYAPFFSALPVVAIVNPRVITPHVKDNDWGAAWLALNDAGSGSYVLDPASYLPQERADLKRFEEHFMGWGDNPRPFDQLKLHPVRETSTRLLALLDGSIDMTDNNLPSEHGQQIESASNVYLERNVSMKPFLIRMQNMRAPFDNINARKCFAHAFNYPGFINEVMMGDADANPGPLPKNVPGFPADVKAYEYDLEKAREYKERAMAEGAPMDRAFEMHTYANAALSLQVAQVFQADLAQIGIDLKIVNSSWTKILTDVVNPDTAPDLWAHWVSAYFVDPENWVGHMYDSRLHRTWKAASYYKNDRVDELLQKARELATMEQRVPLYEDAIRQIVADSPDIWVYNSVELRGLNKRVGGFRFSPVGGGGEIRWMRLEA